MSKSMTQVAGSGHRQRLGLYPGLNDSTEAQQFYELQAAG